MDTPQHHPPIPEAARLLRALRAEAGLTQEALARAIGCSKAQLSLMESGQRTLSLDWARQIESALGISDGRLVSALQWQSVPEVIRAQVEMTQQQSAALLTGMRHALASADPLEALRELVADDEQWRRSNIESPLPLRRQIPVINKIAAGYPAEFTDLGYPASVADEYIACPDVTDPEAFAARVVGDSMAPEYREGDIVVFSPQLDTPSGSDCFVRLERDAETTFKRIYIEDDGRTIRLQPLNNAYPPRNVDREDVGGMYAAAYVMRRVGT